MSTNRETSLRASLSNRSYAAALRVAALLLSVAALLPAQDSVGGDATGFLLAEGPEPRVGIDFLEPNTLPHTYGRYVSPAGTVEVFHLVARPELPDGSVASCSGLAVRIVNGEFVRYAVYEATDYTLFITTGDGFELESICGFLTPFLELFRFYRTVAPAHEVPLPAVIK